MRLVELDPRWFSEYGDNRHGLGLTFRCPCKPACETRLYVYFDKPIDGGPPITVNYPEKLTWQRTGETFETLTLQPSIDASASGHWHGFIKDGEVT